MRKLKILKDPYLEQNYNNWMEKNHGKVTILSVDFGASDYHRDHCYIQYLPISGSCNAGIYTNKRKDSGKEEKNIS